jgi:hypothetical protein
LIESTQIRCFLTCSGGVGWSGRAPAQRRPRVSKLGLKGLSNYHSDEIAVEAARWGPVGRVKWLLSQGIYSRGELDNSVDNHTCIL